MIRPLYELRVKIHEAWAKQKRNAPPKPELPAAEANIVARRRTLAKKHLFIWTMLIIPIASWLVFWLYTNLSMILMAFQTPNGAWTLQHFRTFWNDLTGSSREVRISLRNTFLYFGLNNLIVLPLGTLIAYFIYKKIRGYKFFRVAIFLPAIIPQIVMITSFKQMIDPKGPLAALGMHIPVNGVFSDPKTATPTVMFYCLWTGFSTVMLLMCGSMARIPVEVLEAAKLDGCGPFREFRSLVVPLILPTISTQVIFALTGLFNASGPILLMTGGQADTSTLQYYIFWKTYKNTTAETYNVVSATGLVFTVVALPLILLVKWLTDKMQTVEY